MFSHTHPQTPHTIRRWNYPIDGTGGGTDEFSLVGLRDCGCNDGIMMIQLGMNWILVYIGLYMMICLYILCVEWFTRVTRYTASSSAGWHFRLDIHETPGMCVPHSRLLLLLLFGYTALPEDYRMNWCARAPTLLTQHSTAPTAVLLSFDPI